jgi:hypothetical protein
MRRFMDASRASDATSSRVTARSSGRICEACDSSQAASLEPSPGVACERSSSTASTGHTQRPRASRASSHPREDRLPARGPLGPREPADRGVAGLRALRICAPLGARQEQRAVWREHERSGEGRRDRARPFVRFELGLGASERGVDGERREVSRASREAALELRPEGVRRDAHLERCLAAQRGLFVAQRPPAEQPRRPRGDERRGEEQGGVPACAHRPFTRRTSARATRALPRRATRLGSPGTRRP